MSLTFEKKPYFMPVFFSGEGEHGINDTTYHEPADINVISLTYETDREVWRKLYRQLVQDNEELDNVLEEKSLYWNDDKFIVDTFVLKTIKRFDPANKADQELLPEFRDEEDRDFAINLFRATILNAEQYQHYMSDASRNWDFNRLAYMDVVIMQIAIAEMLTMPNIPVSVTINEYVSLAQYYSTPNSARYINGMLDAISQFLVRTHKMFKPLGDPHIRHQNFLQHHHVEDAETENGSARDNG